MTSDADPRMPNLFLIGAPKCGTSALASQIGTHPAVYLGKKEPRFFDARTFYDFEEDHPIKSLGEYLSLFSGNASTGAAYRLDASVFNMYSESSIREILRNSPDARFICVLRDPVEACFSMHMHRLKSTDTRMRELSDDFCTCWKLVKERQAGHGYPAGCRNTFLFRYDLLYSYELYLPMLLRLIPRDRILFQSYEAYRSSNSAACQEIFEFLGLGPHRVEEAVVNPSYARHVNWRTRAIGILVKRTRKVRKLLAIEKLFPRLVSHFKEVGVVRPEKGSGTPSCHGELAEFFRASRSAMDAVLEPDQ